MSMRHGTQRSTKTDMIGLKFGKLTVLRRVANLRHPNGRCAVVYLCVCECGVQKEIRSTSLVSGDSTSCGCSTNVTHGLSKTPEYKTWISMQSRCYDPNNPSYANYGDRGITVCDEWKDSFESFLNHVGKRPSNQHSIDRIDNNLGYQPGNVRWVTDVEQCSNRRNNRLLTLRGETKTVREWSNLLGFKHQILYLRLMRGWSDEKTLTTPVIKKGVV